MMLGSITVFIINITITIGGIISVDATHVSDLEFDCCGQH